MVSLVGLIAINACSDRGGRGGDRIERASSALVATVAPTDDVSISSQNGGNGVTTTADELMVWSLTGSQGYTEEALIRFGNLSLPAGATVTGASLALTFDNWSTGFTVRGYYVKNPWHVTSALGWLNRDPGVLWTAPGARGSGSDVQASPTFAISGFAGTGVEPKTIALDPAMVQAWVNDPSANQGILLVNEANDAVTRIYSSEDANAARRPALTITYSTSGGSCASGGVGTWANTSFSAGGNPFTATFDATPSAANTDAVVGLSSGAAGAFANLATIVRFNTGGMIDARNGGSYAAVSTVGYAAGSTYHFRLIVDVGAHTYSVFVTPPAGSEQTIASGYAFRSEQGTVTSLNNWAAEVDTDGTGTINVCNFTATASGGGTGSGGATGSGGSSGSGGAGGTGGAGGSGPVAHPRIWLDTATLDAMKARAAAGSAAWNDLVAACESYRGGTVNPVDGDKNPPLPNIGEDYQGAGYLDPLLNVSLCYQIGSRLVPPDPRAADWAAKGSEILSVMAQFTTYQRDDGFGIRFFGVGMALGFDFLYDTLSPSVKSQVLSTLNAWFLDPDNGFDAHGFGNGHPHGNYFAGYYAAKAYAALATEGHNAQAGALWTDFWNRMHFGQPGDLVSPTGPHAGVQWYYSRYLAGGGWSEGWGYGALAVSNMDLPSLAVKTAKGIDLVNYPGAPYKYPLENAMHLIQFTWPSRLLMDDRNLLHDSTNLPNISYPSRPSLTAFAVTSAMLTRWGDPLAPQFHSYTRAVRDALVAFGVSGKASPWQEMLFWDANAPETDFTTLPRTYLSPGLNIVATRSDWQTTATWASFRASGYVDYGYAGEEYYDAGGLAIVKGGMPLLANAHGVLVTDYPGPIGQQTYEGLAADDVGGSKPRKLFNTFANGTGIQEQHFVDAPSPPATRVTHVEDGNGFVRMRGDDIDDVYTAAAQINGWTRDVVFLRPSAFVVYDRTSVADTSGDQHMSWHLFFTPQVVSSPAGTWRYDVTNPTNGFLGSMTTVLPTVSTTPAAPIDVGGTHKVFRVEVRPQTPATTMNWLTVFDTSASPTAVALASVLSGASTNIKGVLLTASGGNSVVAFGSGAAGSNIAGQVSFTIPTPATKVVIADLPLSTAYSVSTAPAGVNRTVTIQTGTGFQTTSNGTLYVNIAANGVPSAGN